MNFTLKNTARSVFAVIIALSMLLSIAMPAIAVTVDEIDRNKDDKINYVALGASNTNGFGLMGYLPDELYGNPISKMDGSVYGYLATPDNAYPSLVKDALAELTGKDVELAQLAISSMRAEELRFLLDETYEGDAYLDWRFYDLPEYPKSGNWFIGAGLQELGTTEATPEEALAALRAAYRDYIAAADVITIDIGANNFGVYASNRIFNNMFDNDFSRFDEEIQENVELFRAQVEKIVTENLGDYLPEDLGDMFSHLVDTLTYAVVGFCVSFDASVEKIYEINPDAKIVVVNIQNLMDGLYATLPGADALIPLGAIYGEVIDLANLYTAALSPYADTYNWAYIGDDGEAEKFLEDIKAYDGNPESLRTAITDCFDVYDNDMFLKTRVLYELTKILVGEGLAHIDPEQASKYSFAGMDEKVFGTAVYENAILYGATGVGFLTVNEFIAKGEAGELAGTPFESYYNMYNAALLTVYDTAATFIQLGANSTVMDLAAAAANFDTVGKEIMQTLFAMLIASMENPGLKIEETPEFQALANDPTAMAIITLGARSDLGNSFFSHPNENGHVEIKDAIMNAIENDLTGLEFVKVKAQEIMDLVTEYYDDAYAFGYEYARDNGYIAIAIDAIAVAEIEIDRAYGLIASTELSDELKAELYEEIDLAKVILADVKAMLENDEIDALDAEALEALYDLLAKLEDALYNIADIAGVAGSDIYELWITEWKPALEIALGEIADAAEAFIQGKLDEAYEMIVALIERLEAKLNEKLEEIENLGNDITGKIEGNINAILDKIAQIKATVKEAVDAVNALRAEIEEKIEEIRNLVEEFNNAVEDTKQQILDTINEIKAEIERIKAEIEELRAKIQAAYAELVATIENVKATIENINDEVAAIIADFEAKVETTQEYIALLQVLVDMIVEGATTGSYTVDADSFYVALGDITAAGDSYADIFAEALGVDYENLAEAGLTVEDVLAALAENEDTIAKADLITIGFGNASVTEFMFAQVNAVISGTEPAEMDWAALIGDGAVLVENAVAALADTLANQGLEGEVMGVNAVELITVAVESYVYAQTARAILYPVLVDAVAEIAPEALIVLVGTYNDLDGIVFDVNGTNVDLGALVEFIADVANLNAFAYALTTENNVMYVGAPNVETKFEDDLANGVYENINLITYFNAIVNGDIAPSEDGHAYIAGKILASLEITKEEIKDPCENGHTFGDWVTVKPATETEEGVKERTCSICGHKETEKIEKLPATTTTTPNVETTDTPVIETTPVEPVTTETPVVETTPVETTPVVTEPAVETTPADDTTPADTEYQGGMPVGAIVGISVGAVAVVAAGGFCLYWFVFKKKLI